VNDTIRDTVLSLLELGLITPAIGDVVSEKVDVTSSHKPKL
jgi:hypothetical protein